MRKIIKIIVICFVVFILLGIGGVFWLSRGLDDQNKITVARVTPSTLSDGVYNGKYTYGRWANEVKITVKDRKIDKIEIVKDVMFSKEEVAKKLLDRVIERQNTDIDIISGSTATCKAYLKSIENALNKNGEEK